MRRGLCSEPFTMPISKTKHNKQKIRQEPCRIFYWKRLAIHTASGKIGIKLFAVILLLLLDMSECVA